MNKLGWLLIAGTGIFLIGCGCCSSPAESGNNAGTKVNLPQACENVEMKQVTDPVVPGTGSVEPGALSPAAPMVSAAERGEEDGDTIN